MKSELARNLKQALKSKDMTAAQLSRATQVPAQTINNWLAGLEPRSMSQVKKIAQYFDMSLDQLAYGEVHTDRNKLEDYRDEIMAGTFEVILRKIKK